jgi:hypothetical protein
MPVVRLKCPACGSVVRIAAEVANQHPVVRCAKCQGLVNVSSCRLPDSPTASSVIVPAASKASAVREVKPRGRQSAEARIDFTLLVRIMIALVVVTFVVVGAYALVSKMTESPHEKAAKKSVEFLDRVVAAYEEVQTAEDVPALMEKLKAISIEARAAKIEMGDLKPLSADEQQRLLEKYIPKFTSATTRLQAAMLHLRVNPEVARAVGKELVELRPELLGLPAVLGQFNPLDMLGGLNPEKRGGFAQANPPARREDAPRSAPAPVGLPKAGYDGDLDFALLTKSALLRMLVHEFKSINDFRFAEAISLGIENTLRSLGETEKEIKDAEAAGKKATPDSVAQYTKEHAEFVAELRREVARVAQVPGAAKYLSKFDRTLKNLGLIQELAFSRPGDDSPPVAKDDKNPFEETGRAKEKNPFEDAGKPEEKSPFEPAKPKNTNRMKEDAAPNPALDEALEKAQSSDVFKRHDGVRELMNARIDEQRKGDVLEVLVTVLEVADSNLRGDAFRAFKRWAKTKEDKERIGKAMEAMLDDVFLKKDVIKFVADYKIATAAPELAKNLKDTEYRLDVARALIAIGPDAEKPTMPFVTDLEPQVRRMAIEVLAQIGTKECIPELTKMQNDRYVARAAREAIRMVNNRNKDK